MCLAPHTLNRKWNVEDLDPDRASPRIPQRWSVLVGAFPTHARDALQLGHGAIQVLTSLLETNTRGRSS
jgi:hypothetical protein